MNVKITNITELQTEIARLTELKREQKAYLSNQYSLLQKKIETPSRVLEAFMSHIPGLDIVKGLFSTVASKNKSNGKSDWLTNTLRVGLPLILNRTFLRGTGWIKKSLVLLASERAAGQINQEKIETLLAKVTDFIRPKKKRKKHKDVAPLTENQENIAEPTIPPTMTQHLNNDEAPL